MQCSPLRQNVTLPSSFFAGWLLFFQVGIPRPVLYQHLPGCWIKYEFYDRAGEVKSSCYKSEFIVNVDRGDRELPYHSCLALRSRLADAVHFTSTITLLSLSSPRILGNRRMLLRSWPWQIGLHQPFHVIDSLFASVRYFDGSAFGILVGCRVLLHVCSVATVSTSREIIYHHFHYAASQHAIRVYQFLVIAQPGGC